MGLYNFKKRFVPFVLNGSKTHTIRALRAHPDKPGNTLHLYTGLRTKNVRLLMRVPCVKVEEIMITFVLGKPMVAIEGVELSASELDAFAKRDGFPKGWQEMQEFWGEAGRAFPWVGQVIHWKRPAPGGRTAP